MNLPVAALLTVAGAVYGSFAATAALRVARGEAWAAGRSRCDHCGVRVAALANVPVAAYVASGGQCRSCGGPIHPLHLTGELAGAALFVTAGVATDGGGAALMLILAALLLALALVDLTTQRIPDVLSLGVAAVGLGLSALAGRDALIAGLAAGAVGFGLLEGLRRLYRRRAGRDGLGFGDVKLVGALGLWLGADLPWAVALASGLGLAAALALRTGKGRLAFGPFLALGAWTIGLGRVLWPTLFP